MNIAITLVIQGFVFFFVAWLVMKFIWPFLLVKIETRQKVIADGLAAAAKSEKDLNEAEARSKEIIREARERAAQIVDQASKRSNEMIEEAKGTASSEAQRLIASAHEEVSLETTRARESLRREVGELAVEGASRLLGREIDARTHADLLDKLSADQKFAYDVLKVDATPTFFINGEMLKGSMSFEELDKKIKSLLKN